MLDRRLSDNCGLLRVKQGLVGHEGDRLLWHWIKLLLSVMLGQCHLLWLGLGWRLQNSGRPLLCDKFLLESLLWGRSVLGIPPNHLRY